MTSTEFRERLSSRARNAGLSIPTDDQARLEEYFALLTRWNATINLTALPMRQPTDETFDRLLIEPLAAAQYVANSARFWIDVGSGGGSPAIPMKIAHPRLKLTLTESRTRKAAFLREAVRALDLADVDVEDVRFEALATRVPPRSIDLVTVRAVRGDVALFDAIHPLLHAEGRLFVFNSGFPSKLQMSRFSSVDTVSLKTSANASISILTPVFHVEQKD